MSSVDWLTEEKYNLIKEKYMPKKKKKIKKKKKKLKRKRKNKLMWNPDRVIITILLGLSVVLVYALWMNVY